MGGVSALPIRCEMFFLLGDVVATRIDERVRTCGIIPNRVFPFESEVAAMGTEENIAWQ